MFEGQGGGEGSASLESLIRRVVEDDKQREKSVQDIKKIRDDLTLVKGLICDSQGNCRLPSREDLIRLAGKGKISPEGTIRKDNHPAMYELLKACPDCKKGIQGDSLQEMPKDPKLMMEAANNPEFRKAFLASICSDEKCRTEFNRDIDEVRSQGAGKGFFLDKEKK